MMHVLVIIDDARRAQEEQSIKDMLLGIQEADMQVTEILQSPESSRDELVRLSTDSPLQTPMPLNWILKRRIIDSLSREIGRTLPDAIIAFGQFATPIAHELAISLELPLVVECWETDHIRRPPLRPQMASAFATASSGLAAAMRERNEHHLVATTPYPIEVVNADFDKTDQPPSIAIIDAESDIGNTRRILESLAEIVPAHPDLHLFIELGTSKSNVVWRHAESLGLLERTSSFSNASMLRPLLGDCTLMLVANSTCCTRSVIDEAMARGCVVLRPDHPMLTSSDRAHQCLLTESDKGGWIRAIENLLSDSDRRTRLAEMAHDHVRQQNDPNRVISTWKQLIHEVSANSSYPLANAGTTGT